MNKAIKILKHLPFLIFYKIRYSKVDGGYYIHNRLIIMLLILPFYLVYMIPVNLISYVKSIMQYRASYVITPEIKNLSIEQKMTILNMLLS